jgi:hypothetical protein
MIFLLILLKFSSKSGKFDKFDKIINKKISELIYFL